MTKICKQCLVARPLEDFYKLAKMSDGLHYYCKECMRTRTSQWRKNNPQKVVEATALRTEYFVEYGLRPEVVAARKKRASDWSTANRVNE